jgi:hypothetical protein
VLRQLQEENRRFHETAPAFDKDLLTTKLEFKGSPQDVTVREKLDYTFDLTPWLAAGETVDGATARLTDEMTGQDINGVVSDLLVSGGNKVRNESTGASQQF